MIGSKYKVGFKFKLQRGNRSEEIREILDIYTTKDTKGHIVKIRYVTRHIVLGQAVIDHSVVRTTIDIAVAKEKLNKER